MEGFFPLCCRQAFFPQFMSDKVILLKRCHKSKLQSLCDVLASVIYHPSWVVSQQWGRPKVTLNQYDNAEALFFSVFQVRPLSRAPFDGPSSQRFWCTIPKALTGTRSIKMLSTWWDLSSRARPSVSLIFSHDSGNDKEEQDVPCTRGECFVVAIPTRVHKPCTKVVQDNKSHCISFLFFCLFSSLFQHRLIVLCWEAGQSDDREPKKNCYHY